VPAAATAAAPAAAAPSKSPLDPSLAPIRDFYDGRAAEMLDEYETHYWRLYDAITWETVKPLLPGAPGARILDAGGGYGLWTLHMARSTTARIDLVDLSESMLAVAREQVATAGLGERVRIHQSDLRQLTMFADSTFDFILCEGDPVSICTMLGIGADCLREIARVLKPGSPLCLGLDSRPGLVGHALGGSIEAAERLLADGYENVFHEHGTHGFTLEEVDRLLDSCGLERRDAIGKPVLHNHLPRAEAERRLADPGYFARALALELEYARQVPYRDFGEHLQVVAVKA
jgi:SAM-dependent methyltransferase